MANVGAYAEKLALDFLLNTQTATRPPRAGAGTGILFGQIAPARSTAQHPQDAFQNRAILGPRPPKATRRR